MEAVPPPVLEWLSELDLCKRITCRPADMQRNVSSGVLLAEICAKYFPRDIASAGTLGAFDRVTSPVFKRDSWSKLLRLLEMNGISLPRDCVEAAIDGRPGAVSVLLSNLYIALARRRPGAGCPQVRQRSGGGERFASTNPGFAPTHPELPMATNWRLLRSAETTNAAPKYRSFCTPLQSPMRRYKSTGHIDYNSGSPLWAVDVPWPERGEARMSRTWSDRIAAKQLLRRTVSGSTMSAFNQANGMNVLNSRTMGATSMSC
eukprot:gnl/MRDRNA2_/MRDRNA2_28059_c0_seq1.p1 gnl/MRDRNA2_/MRDRNA2_28059_c0~~gnl/MRDRNA2_/MRDRNA2_28059_c0_seq1.p1  ORF type:complete len:261 (-),score=32.39 gnl/MRDRNA2_/MRDRNA2_28059_c0_seq1:151-933(-)